MDSLPVKYVQERKGRHAQLAVTLDDYQLATVFDQRHPHNCFSKLSDCGWFDAVACFCIQLFHRTEWSARSMASCVDWQVGSQFAAASFALSFVAPSIATGQAAAGNDVVYTCALADGGVSCILSSGMQTVVPVPAGQDPLGDWLLEPSWRWLACNPGKQFCVHMFKNARETHEILIIPSASQPTSQPVSHPASERANQPGSQAAS